MTSTINTTQDLTTYVTRPPVLRRSDVSGEFPFYQPATIGDVDELARLALGATLVLPINAEPAPPRHAVPTVYMPAPVSLAAVMPQPSERPPGYRGTRRMVEPPIFRTGPRWAWLVLGLGAGLIGQAVGAGLAVLAVTR